MLALALAAGACAPPPEAASSEAALLEKAPLEEARFEGTLPARYAAASDFDAFPAYVWCEHGAPPLPETFRAAFGGAEANRGRPPAGAQDWRLYVGQAAGRGELHLERADIAASHAAWLAERGDALPARPHDLGSRELAALLAQRVAAHVRAAPGADFVSLGDEVGATPWGDPVDFARAAAGPGTDVALGGLAGPDELLFASRREAERAELLALLDHLADAARAADPDVRLALLGSGPATPFATLVARDVAPRFDVLEPYDAGLAREAFGAVATPQHTLLRTVTVESCAASAWQVFEHLARGGDGAVLWQRRELVERPDVADAIARAIATARHLVGDLGARFPEPRGVAVLVHEPGDRALWLAAARRDRLGWPARLAGFEAREGPAFARRLAFTSALEEVGTSPGVLDVGALREPSSTTRFPLVVATGLDLARSDVAQALEAHLERDGHVLLDDDQGLAVPRAYEPRLVRAPHGVDHLALDRAPTSARSLRRRAALRAMVDGVLGAPVVDVERVDGGPLFVARAALPDGGQLVLALAAADGADERARLTEWRVRCVPGAGAAGLHVHWLGYDDAADVLVVPAGWPALLVVRPRA